MERSEIRRSIRSAGNHLAVDDAVLDWQIRCRCCYARKPISEVAAVLREDRDFAGADMKLYAVAVKFIS